MPDTDVKWWQVYDNVVLLAHWMADEGYTAEELAYAIEKPWKHEDDFLAAQAAQQADK